VLRDRKLLSGDGVIVAIVSMDRHTGKPIGRPDVVSRGFIEADMSDSLMEKARQVVEEALSGQEHVANRADFNARVHDSLSRFLYSETRRRPMILPVSVEI
jgi:ribonuclease J